MTDGVERSPQMANRLLVGAAAQGLARCALMVGDRAHKLVATLEMLCQLGCDSVEPVGPGGLEPIADTYMAHRPACCWQALVEEFTVEIMSEGKKLRTRAIWPNRRSGLDDEHTLSRKTGAGSFDLDHRRSPARRRQRGLQIRGG